MKNSFEFRAKLFDFCVDVKSEWVQIRIGNGKYLHTLIHWVCQTRRRLQSYILDSGLNYSQLAILGYRTIKHSGKSTSFTSFYEGGGIWNSVHILIKIKDNIISENLTKKKLLSAHCSFVYYGKWLAFPALETQQIDTMTDWQQPCVQDSLGVLIWTCFMLLPKWVKNTEGKRERERGQRIRS